MRVYATFRRHPLLIINIDYSGHWMGAHVLLPYTTLVEFFSWCCSFPLVSPSVLKIRRLVVH